MAKLTIIMGMPGSGKTTLAKTLKGKKVHIDEVRKSITGSYIPNSDDIIVYQTIKNIVEYYLEKNEDVVLDGAFLSIKARSFYINIAKKFSSNIELHWLDASLDLVLERIEKRNKVSEKDRVIDEEYIKQLSTVFEIPTKSEGYHKINYYTDKELFFNF
jgi:predicted kinase